MTDPTPTRAEVVHRMARNMIASHSKKDLAEWGLALEAENQALRERAEAAERAEADAWNDAIEAAGNLESIHGYSNAVPRHRIRALRRAAPTEDR